MAQAPRNNFKADQTVDDALKNFFTSRCFASCVRHRRLLAVLVVICWTSYCFVVWRMVNENEQPDALADVTFCFLAAAPMAVCMYFMCGFHQVGFRPELAYAVQSTLDDQRLGINIAGDIHFHPSRLPKAALDELAATRDGLGDRDCVPLLLSDVDSDEDVEFRADTL